MKNLISALICCVLAVTITLVGYGNMPSASAQEITPQCPPGGGIVDIPLNMEVLLCPGTSYQFVGTALPTDITFSNTSDISAEIVFTWANRSKSYFIEPGAKVQTSLIFGAGRKVTITNKGAAPVLLTITQCNPEGGIINIPLNTEVLLCRGTCYEFGGIDLPTTLAFTNTSDIYPAKILLTWEDRSKSVFIPEDGETTYTEIFGGGRRVRVTNNSDAPVLLTIRPLS